VAEWLLTAVKELENAVCGAKGYAEGEEGDGATGQGSGQLEEAMGEVSSQGKEEEDGGEGGDVT